MSETPNRKYIDVGVAYLTRSGKAININIEGKTGIISVQSLNNLIDGKYSTANISRPEQETPKLKISCYAFLRHKAGSTIKKAKYYPESGILEYRERIFKPTVFINVPSNVTAEPYRRRRNIFFVDVEQRTAVPSSGNITISETGIKIITDKLDAIAIKRYWKFLGGRALTTIETIIFLAAGYGILRFIEYLVTVMYG